MIIVEEYTQNELYFIEKLKETRDIFLERVQNNINRVTNGNKEKIIDITHFIGTDNLRHCIVTYSITKQEYKKLCS